jgi:hypothetical protein
MFNWFKKIFGCKCSCQNCPCGEENKDAVQSEVSSAHSETVASEVIESPVAEPSVENPSVESVESSSEEEVKNL